MVYTSCGPVTAEHTSACLHRTKVVKDNGFNPQWSESFKFKFIFPGLAILRFMVMDADTLSNDFIGQYSLPLESLAPGQLGEGSEGVCVWMCVGAFMVVERCRLAYIVYEPATHDVSPISSSFATLTDVALD